MNRYDAYDVFARVYNRHWGSFGTRVYPILEYLVLRHLPGKGAILDLCSGTGQLAARLVDEGYAVTGVDGSAAMVQIAARNAPGADFVVQDAREQLPSRGYLAVFSTFDSLNHLMTLEELAQVFVNVREALAEGGYFAFDLNMAAAYKTRWHQHFVYVEDDHVCVARPSTDPARCVADMALTIFESEGGAWKRSDVNLEQRWYAEGEVLGALRSAGFKYVRSYNGEQPLYKGCPVHQGRMFFLARI